jgi:hypothetical protein
VSLMNETFQHSITRAHVWIAAMTVIGALHGPFIAFIGAGLIAVVHILAGTYISSRAREKEVS